MLNRKSAIKVLFLACWANVVKADEPPSPSVPDKNRWTINLNKLEALDIWLDDRVITVTPAELFAALKQ